MAPTMPAVGISLHGPAEDVAELKPGTSSAILLKFGEDVLQDLKNAVKDELRFVTGNTPVCQRLQRTVPRYLTDADFALQKLRIGGRTIDLSISVDAFRNELYASTTGTSTADFTFTSIISHRAELKSSKQHGAGAGETAGTDAALAALQNSLASYKQEKEANQTTIANKVLDVPKNRWDAARKEKLDRKKRLLDSRHGSQPPSPSLSAMGTPRLGAAPTSAPLSEDEVRLKAMRKPLVHLLAIGPTTKEEIRSKTHIPKDDLDVILQKVGKQVDGKWQLAERAFKELDVWNFKYPSESDREATVDNAIRAYDRLRLGKEDNLWQLLLPEEERGKGKVLSRLHLNGGVGAAKASLPPHYQPSPMPHVNSGEEKMASSANTPRLGASTPRPTSSKGDVMKRLLSKDPQKAHRIEEAKMRKTKAAEEAKEKKRKEKEDAASDREGRKPVKRQATAKKANPKVKSADIVHSSDDESGEDGEVKERITSQPKPKQTPAKKATASSTSPEESSDSAKPIKDVKKIATKAKPSQTAAKPSASPAVKAAKPTAGAMTGKATPQMTNGLSAPSSQHKARSPSAVGSRPGVPSPLGAARPRVASDVSDRNAVGVQRVRQGAETPKGLGITNGVRKRADTATSKCASTPIAAELKSKEMLSSDKTSKPTVNGSAQPKTNGTVPKYDTGTKRKAPDSQPDQQAPKHRKTGSSSSLTLSVSATNSSTTSNQTAQTSHTAQTSPDASACSSSDTSAVLDTISYKTGVNQAEKFREQFYPAYIALYDEIEGMRARGEKVGREKVEQLRKWHERLVEMKREIRAASRRERGEE